MENKNLEIVVIDDIAENLKLFKLMLAKVDPENSTPGESLLFG